MAETVGLEFEEWPEASAAAEDYRDKGYKVVVAKKRRGDKTVYRVIATPKKATPAPEEKAEKAEKKRKTLGEEFEEAQEAERKIIAREKGKKAARVEHGPDWLDIERAREDAETAAEIKYSREAGELRAKKAVAKEFPEFRKKVKEEEKLRKRKLAGKKGIISKREKVLRKVKSEAKKGTKKAARKTMKRVGGQVLRKPSEFKIVRKHKGALYMEESKKPRIAGEIDTSMMRWPR